MKTIAAMARRCDRGFAAARKEFVFYTDGDGQYDPGELPLLLERMGPKTGLVNGYKIERNDPAASRVDRRHLQLLRASALPHSRSATWIAISG